MLAAGNLAAYKNNERRNNGIKIAIRKYFPDTKTKQALIKSKTCIPPETADISICRNPYSTRGRIMLGADFKAIFSLRLSSNN